MRGRIAVFAIVAAAAIAALAGLGFAAPNKPQMLAQRGDAGGHPGRRRGGARGRCLLLDGPGRAGAAARRLYGGADLARIPSGVEAGHARPHRADLFRMGRHAPSADHRAVAADRRAGVGRRLCRRHRPRALHARLAHLDLGRAVVCRAAVRGQRLSRRPPGDRRVRRRRQQQRPAGHGHARRGACQGHHHQRPADPAEAAERQHARYRAARHLLRGLRDRRAGRVRHPDQGARRSSRRRSAPSSCWKSPAARPSGRIVPVAAAAPRISCTIGERLWQERWGNSGTASLFVVSLLCG